MPNKVLVHYQENWCDEFDVKGLALLDGKEWEKMQENARKNPNLYWHFGTNMCFEYDDVERFLECFWDRSISDNEAEILKKNIRGISSGYGVWPRDMFDESKG